MLRHAARMEAGPRRRHGRRRGATCRSPPPTRSNGRRGGSTWPCSAHSCPPVYRRHLLCRAAGRDLARQAQDQLRAGARPGDRRNDRRRTIVRGIAKQVRQVDLLDHRRASSGLRWRSAFPAAPSWGWSDRHLPAAPRCWLPARRRGDRRGCGRQRSGADLRRPHSATWSSASSCWRSRRGWRRR